jgi:peptide/nickel transport system substrate-binding protein
MSPFTPFRRAPRALQHRAVALLLAALAAACERGTSSGVAPNAPARPASVVVHSDALPQSLNYLIDNSAMCRRLQRETHEALLTRDAHTLELRPVLCTGWRREDALVLTSGERLYGELEALEHGWRVKSSAAADAREVPAAQIARVVRGAAYTFDLRRDVLWHDGEPFDEQDVLFTWRMTRNPLVELGAKRDQFERIVAASSPAPFVVRFEYDKTYFGSLESIEALAILPRHLYDLHDPANRDHAPDASAEQQARYVNTHRCNREWIGLGPFRVASFTSEFLELERFERYFDPQRAAGLARVRLRPIADDRAAFQALLAGELDFSARLHADDYLGEVANSPAFSERFEKGAFYTPIATFVAWNLQRELFRDPAVRRALALAFDWDEFIASFYRGMARRVTAEWVDTGADYDESLAPLPYDPLEAARLLAQAGWIDRDGDGRLDKDGEPFEFALALLAGNQTGESLSQRLQESLARLGIGLAIESFDWPSLSERVKRRNFDAVVLGWTMPVDNDPAARWHSRTIGEETNNYCSFSDAQIDAWIEQVEVELDRAERTRLMHAIQARLYALQPYMYGVTVPKRYALSRRIAGFRASRLDPGFALREWRLSE